MAIHGTILSEPTVAKTAELKIIVIIEYPKGTHNNIAVTPQIPTIPTIPAITDTVLLTIY